MVSGDILEINVNNPTLGAFTFFPKAGEAGTFDPGGFTSADDAQMLDGGGRMIDQMTRKRWSLETVVSWAMAEQDEVARLQALQNSLEESTFTISHISGTVWTGKGKIVGDINGDTNAGTVGFKAGGGAQLVRQ